MNRTDSTNPTTLARRAGWLYLLLVPLGIYTLLYIPELIWVPGDAELTLNQLLNHESAFRWSVVTAFAIQVTQLFAAVALYDLFKVVHKRMAMWIVLFTLAAMPIAMLNEIFHIAALYLINGPFADHLAPEQAQQWLLLMFELHADGIMIAHVFWGFWLLPMGYLAWKSGFAPAFMGWLLMLASAAYVADSVLWFTAPQWNIGFAEYVGWSEILLPLWLVVKGVRNEAWQLWQPTVQLTPARA